jgi:hypothetical protein
MIVGNTCMIELIIISYKGLLFSGHRSIPTAPSSQKGTYDQSTLIIVNRTVLLFNPILGSHGALLKGLQFSRLYTSS